MSKASKKAFKEKISKNKELSEEKSKQHFEKVNSTTVTTFEGGLRVVLQNLKIKENLFRCLVNPFFKDGICVLNLGEVVDFGVFSDYDLKIQVASIEEKNIELMSV